MHTAGDSSSSSFSNTSDSNTSDTTNASDQVRAGKSAADPRTSAQFDASADAGFKPLDAFGRSEVPGAERDSAQILEGESASSSTDATHALLNARLQQLETTVRDKEELHLRARAEAENVRRRAQEDVLKASRFAIEGFAESLVPVKDSLEAALATPNQSLETLLAGVDITLKQLSAAFERHRLLEIAPDAGTTFDPNRHQAISSAPSELAANSVIQTLQKGYLIADRVLRPALVIVSKPE